MTSKQKPEVWHKESWKVTNFGQQLQVKSKGEFLPRKRATDVLPNTLTDLQWPPGVLDGIPMSHTHRAFFFFPFFFRADLQHLLGYNQGWLTELFGSWVIGEINEWLQRGSALREGKRESRASGLLGKRQSESRSEEVNRSQAVATGAVRSCRNQPGRSRALFCPRPVLAPTPAPCPALWVLQSIFILPDTCQCIHTAIPHTSVFHLNGGKIHLAPTSFISLGAALPSMWGAEATAPFCLIRSRRSHSLQDSHGVGPLQAHLFPPAAHHCSPGSLHPSLPSHPRTSQAFPQLTDFPLAFPSTWDTFPPDPLLLCPLPSKALPRVLLPTVTPTLVPVPLSGPSLSPFHST